MSEWFRDWLYYVPFLVGLLFVCYVKGLNDAIGNCRLTHQNQLWCTYAVGWPFNMTHPSLLIPCESVTRDDRANEACVGYPSVKVWRSMDQ